MFKNDIQRINFLVLKEKKIISYKLCGSQLATKDLTKKLKKHNLRAFNKAV